MKSLIITDDGYTPARGVRSRILVQFVLEHSRPEGGCLIWMGEKANGHGWMRIDGTMIRIQRLAWSLSRGRPVPEYATLEASCGSGLCVRPDHLVLL